MANLYDSCGCPSTQCGVTLDLLVRLIDEGAQVSLCNSPKGVSVYSMIGGTVRRFDGETIHAAAKRALRWTARNAGREYDK